MKTTYYPYKHPGDTRYNVDKPVWSWNQVLFEEARKAMESSDNKFNLGVFAPIAAFHEPPMRGHLVPLFHGMIIEVELPHHDRMRTEMLDKAISPVWIAECLHMLGYYILVRWCGAKPSDGAFWVHAANAHVHQVGYTELNRPGGYALCPPYTIFGNRQPDEWMEYVQKTVLGRQTPNERFDLRGNEIGVNKFKVNERVETIHDEESSMIAPAVVKRILGRRVLLEYSKADIDKSEYIPKDNMWKDMNDDLIYPVGFAETMGLKMTANKKYRAHVEVIARAIKEGNPDPPYTRFDAKQETIYQWKENLNAKATWQVNMCCEMIDRLDECQNQLKAARVLRVLPDGYLQLGPEGPDIVNDSFHIHQTSHILFPVGFAKQHGILLNGPKGDNEEAFEWKSFLKRTNYPVAPDDFFHEATEADVPFKVGTRLEAIDQNEKMLCPATVKAVKGRLVLVAFDGWDDEFDQLYDFRSNELLPCGWGEMAGHALQRPERMQDKELVAEQADESMDED